MFGWWRVERFRLDSNNFTRVYLLVGGEDLPQRLGIERLGKGTQGVRAPK